MPLRCHYLGCIIGAGPGKILPKSLISHKARDELRWGVRHKTTDLSSRELPTTFTSVVPCERPNSCEARVLDRLKMGERIPRCARFGCELNAPVVHGEHRLHTPRNLG